MNICLNDKIFETLCGVVTSENVKAYVIGGWVRDCLLKRDHPDKDIDIVVIGSGIEIARKAARKIGPGIKVSVFKNFGTAMFKNDEYEIVGTLEANPALGKISNESPVGRALLGHKVGEEVVVQSPLKIKYKILKIKYS